MAATYWNQHEKAEGGCRPVHKLLNHYNGARDGARIASIESVTETLIIDNQRQSLYY